MGAKAYAGAMLVRVLRLRLTRAFCQRVFGDEGLRGRSARGCLGTRAYVDTVPKRVVGQRLTQAFCQRVFGD